MSITAVTGQDYSLDTTLQVEEFNKRKREEEESPSSSKIRKLDTDAEFFPLLKLPSELLCRVIQQVANGYWYSKSCQNMLSVNKTFHNDIMIEVLKFDGLNEGEFASDISNELKQHPSSDLLQKRESFELRNCILKFRGSSLGNGGLLSLFFPQCKTLTLSSCDSEDIVDVSRLKNLQVLSIRDCKHLTGEGIFLPFLASHPLQWLTLKDHKHLSNNGLSNLSQQAKLKGLDLEGCEKLTTIPDSDLTELTSLRLANCKKITQASLSALTVMPKIQKLSLEDHSEPTTLSFSSPCSDLLEFTLKSYSDLPSLTLSDLPKFQKLIIEGCPKLTSLTLSNLPKLQEVTIKGFRKLPDFDFLQLPNMRSVKSNPDGDTKITFSS